MSEQLTQNKPKRNRIIKMKLTIDPRVMTNHGIRQKLDILEREEQEAKNRHKDLDLSHKIHQIFDDSEEGTSNFFEYKRTSIQTSRNTPMVK